MRVKKYSFKDVVESQNYGLGFYGLGGGCICATIPFAWPITLLMLRFRVSANSVTFMRAVILVCALVSIAFFDNSGWINFFLVFLFVVLDSVDGQICRVTNTASYFGKLFDGYLDCLAELFLPVSISLALYINFDDFKYFILGITAFGCWAMHCLFLLRTAVINQSLPAGPQKKSCYYDKSLVVVNDLRFLLVFMALLMPSFTIFYYLLIGVYCMTFIASGIYLTTFAWLNFRVRKASRSQSFSLNKN
jgi:phosphatidylglycerophosphate synthase